MGEIGCSKKLKTSEVNVVDATFTGFVVPNGKNLNYVLEYFNNQINGLLSSSGTFVKLDGTTPLTANWNAGLKEITANKFIGNNGFGFNLGLGGNLISSTTTGTAKTWTLPNTSGTIALLSDIVTAIAIKDEGTTLTSTPASLNFVGSAVTATTVGNNVTVSISGGSGSGTVTDVAALTLGTTGTDVSSSVVTSTTTPVITLNIPTASATNRGALSSANWTTFNGKIGGFGTLNYIPKFTASGTIGDSLIQDDGTNVSVNASTDVLYKFKVYTNTNDYALGGYNNKVGGAGVVGYSNGTGTQAGVVGIANSSSATMNIGAAGTAINGAIAIGVKGTASGASSVKYGAQFQDGTEGVGKFLKSITSDGKANWATLTSSDVSGVQASITLTTTGTSGAATFIGNTLNVPTYTLAGLGGIGLTSLTASTPLSYNNTTGAFSIQVANTSQNGYLSSTDWNTFNNKGSGTVSSVGLSMPSAFSVASSPVTGSGTIAVTGAGTVSQYVRGDGTLASFPSSTGGGASLSFYLNGSVSQGTLGGVAFAEIDKTPIFGAGTDFTIAADGYIQSFITDAGVPGLLEIPSGNWNFQTYFSASSNGGTPSFYIELYKWDGATLSLIASNSATPEGITNGTAIDLYTTSLAVPQTALLVTDRLAVRIYVTHSGKTIKLHTEDSHLCQIITTFSTGLTALNGLTSQVQNLAVGTTGTDFAISSTGTTHTFNLPTASATNRGALSSANWTTFNSKVGGTGTTNYLSKFTASGTIGDSAVFETGGNVGIGTITPSASLHINNIGTGNSFLVEDSASPDVTPFVVDASGNVGAGILIPTRKLDINGVSRFRNFIGIDNSDSTVRRIFFTNGDDLNTYASGEIRSSELHLYNNATKVLSVINNNIGIGTITPGSKLEVNGDIKISTIVNATTNTDKFLVSDSGVVKYRTASQTLSDLGAIGLTSLSATTPLSYNNTSGAISIQVATTAQNGYLSFADWNTFSGKVGGSGTANYISKFTASGTIANSLIQDNGTYLGISTAPVTGVRVTVDGVANTAIHGKTTGNGKYGLQGANTSDGLGTFVGVYGTANDNGGSLAGTIYVGGRFFASNNNDTTNVYSLWLQDGTESAGRFLKSITADGKAQWATMSVADTGLAITTTGTSGAATLVGNTLNIPQYSGGTSTFNYGLSYAMSSQNILL